MKSARIILVNPSHPGNIGAAARAMKNMGLSDLYLVSPEKYPHKDATIRAVGADDILVSANVTETLAEALEGCELVFATSARIRGLAWPQLNPREAAEKIVSHADQHKAAIVFGREQAGLTNEELALSHYHVHIPTEESFSSLNLAAAVQVLAYELKMAIPVEQLEEPLEEELATMEELAGFYTHLEKSLIKLRFLDPKHPKLLMRRLQRLCHRAKVDRKEMNILRGILSAIDKYMLHK